MNWSHLSDRKLIVAASSNRPPAKKVNWLWLAIGSSTVT